MKFLKLIAVLFLTACAVEAATIGKIKVDFTGIPADGNTLVMNGTTRTFKTTVTSSATQVQIGGSAAATAANLYAQLQSYPITSCGSIQNDADTVTIIGALNLSMTTSLTGVWGTSVVTTTTITQYGVNVPLSGEPAATRAPIASALIESLEYSTSLVPVSSVPFGNFVFKSTDQFVDGVKTFRGANVYSNANQWITLGNLSNLTSRMLKLRYDATEKAGIYFQDSAHTPIYTIMPDSAGKPSLKTLTGDAWSAGPSYTPTADHILSKGIADTTYGRLTANQTWTGKQTSSKSGEAIQLATDGIIHAGILSNMIGTNVTIGATNLYVTNFFGFGTFTMTNGFPQFALYDTDGGTDQKLVLLSADAGVLNLEYGDDAGGGYSQVFDIPRSGASYAAAYFRSSVPFWGLSYIKGDTEIHAGSHIKAAGVLMSGATNAAAATGLSKGIYVQDGTTPSADPTTGWFETSVSGERLYRNSAANEGAGQNNRAHNRAAQVVGSGSDFVVAGTPFARVDFGTTDPEIALPTAGTYLVDAEVSFLNGATANDNIQIKLYNSTDTADVASSERSVTSINASQRVQIRSSNILTVTAGKTIQLYGQNSTAARGTFEAVRTVIRYVRLY
jgi:hypothetical protein